MSEAKHTPVPWEAKSLMVVAGRDSIAHCGGMLPPARVEESVANAAFIVLAANSHNTLLAACEAALTNLESVHRDYPKDPPMTWAQLMDQLRAAISSATPEKT